MLTACYCLCWLIFPHTPAKPRVSHGSSGQLGICSLFLQNLSWWAFCWQAISLWVKCSDPLKISMDRAIQLKSLKVKIHLILSSTNLNRDSGGPLFPWKQSIGRAFLLWGESLQFVLSDRPNSDVVVIWEGEDPKEEVLVYAFLQNLFGLHRLDLH